MGIPFPARWTMKDRNEIEVGRQERKWGDGLRFYSGIGCSSGDELVSFVEGRMTEQNKQKVRAHLGQCAACREAVFQLRATERALELRKENWLGFLSGKRLVLAGGAAFVLVAAAAIWTAWPTRHELPRGTVALNAPQTPAESTAGQNGKESRGLRSGKPKPNRTSVIAKAKTSDPVETGKATEHSKSIVALNDAGTSEIAERAMKMVVLLGPKHAYKIDPEDPKTKQRELIEKGYADQVAADEKMCDDMVASGEDPDQENVQLKSALEEAANERDSQLAELYHNPEDVRSEYPELKVDGDGPYQVVEVTYKVPAQAAAPVLEDFVVVAPWPGYDVSDQPYGWTFGRHYRPTEFRRHYVAWHDSHVGVGLPVYHGLVGRSGPVEVSGITRTISGRITYRSSAFRSTKRQPGLSLDHLPQPGSGQGSFARSSAVSPMQGGADGYIHHTDPGRLPNVSKYSRSSASGVTDSAAHPSAGGYVGRSSFGSSEGRRSGPSSFGESYPHSSSSGRSGGFKESGSHSTRGIPSRPASSGHMQSPGRSSGGSGRGTGAHRGR